jgi:hypothetical protein
MMVPGAEMHMRPRGAAYWPVKGLVRAVVILCGLMCVHCMQIELKGRVVIRSA